MEQEKRPMQDGYRIFWGDTHHNTYLDFYAGAYYTPAYVTAPVREDLAGEVTAPHGGHLSESTMVPGTEWQGVHLEGLKDLNALAREWDEFQQVTAACNRPGQFVTFPGYEWQGDGRWGDHNVIYEREGFPLCTASTLTDLYAFMRGLDIGAVAIPHHTAYYTGQRAPTWAACDDRLSPFAEVFSIHGCSETDEEWIGLRHNSHMGPGVGGSTYQEALDHGLHLGAICSTDNWANVPGHWGQGLMACVARELSRESLWEAFQARRVYGVTGDRIELGFACNDAPMGSVIAHSYKRSLSVQVRGSDALDRIEILRNGRVIATYCHQGTWMPPQTGQRTRFKLRIEPGWGPRLGEIPLSEQRWDGFLAVDGGCIVGWEPCWIARDQGVPQLHGAQARFTMVSRQENVTKTFQGATLFEFEAALDAVLSLRLNSLEIALPISQLAARSHLLWYKDECIKLVRDTTGIEPESTRRGDVYYQLACKAKIHKVLPESAYTASFEIVDDEPLEGETNYRVRVEQRNGQRAWSSPIWVRCSG
jgi:hypothetical protein